MQLKPKVQKYIIRKWVETNTLALEEWLNESYQCYSLEERVSATWKERNTQFPIWLLFTAPWESLIHTFKYLDADDLDD